MKITVLLHVATCGLGLYDITSHNTSRMLNLHDLFLSLSDQPCYSNRCQPQTLSVENRQHPVLLTALLHSSFHFERWIITLSCYHDSDVTSRVTFIRSPLPTAILHSVTIDVFSCRHFTPSSGNFCKTIRSTDLINGAVREDCTCHVLLNIKHRDIY